MPRHAFSRLALAGLITSVADGLFASIMAVAFYGSTATRLFQGVASTLLGKNAFEGGTQAALIGILMHCGVAFAWSAVFLLLFERSSVIRRLVRSPLGVIKVAAVYGPVVWMVMSLIVIPLLVHRPPTITARWWIQFFGHMLFVGFPIVASISRVRDEHAVAPRAA